MAAARVAAFGASPSAYVCSSAAIASSSADVRRSTFLPLTRHGRLRSVWKISGRCRSPGWRKMAVAGMGGAEEVAEYLVKGAVELTGEGVPGWGSSSLLLPALLWYTTAAPGSMSGLLDFLSAPVYAKMQPTFVAEEVELGRQLGEGSFGVVYEGYVGKKGGKKRERIHAVLKKAKMRVAGACEVHDTEVYMNYRVKRTAPGACADFLGTVEVGAGQVKGRLTEGLWLMWRYQGDRTLDYYMKQRNFPENIAEAVLGAKAKGERGSSKEEILEYDTVVVKKVMFQVLCNLRDLHASGVVHRDVKPLNLVLDENRGCFMLIDLGACVDLRSGYNYSPHETILDPTHAAPEQYVMPTCTPELPPDPLCSLISPLVWLLNSPDRFDLYSAGMVLMQLCLKSLRHDPGLLAFNRDLSRANHDLDDWRKRCRVADTEFALLDADNGAGWELARALLQARPDKASVVWPSLGNSSRPSAAGALRHRFLRGSGFPFPLPRIPTDVVGNLGRLVPDVKEMMPDPKVLAGAIFASRRNRGVASKAIVPEVVVAPIALRQQSGNSRSLENLLGGAVLAASRFSRRQGGGGGESLSGFQSPNEAVSMSVDRKSGSQSSAGPTSDNRTWATSRIGGTESAPLEEEPILINRLKGAVGPISLIGSSVGSAVGASLPAAAALIAGWVAWTGLKASSEMTYDLGRGAADSLGMSATAFLAFFLLVKPWLEVGAEGEREESSRRRKADVAVTGAAAVGGSSTLEKILVKRREQTAAFESLGLDDAVEAMYKQMASLEACLASERRYSQEQKQRLSRLQGLLQ